MAVLTSPRRTRPRFGPQAGLVAAVRGVAFTGLTLAGLGLLIVIVGAVFLTALGAAFLIAGNRGPQDSHMLLALVVLGAGLGLARFAVPPALLGIRGLARLTRQLAGDWCGVPVAERYAPRPAGTLTYTGRLRWLATDPATWRDVAWTAANLVAVVLAALPAAAPVESAAYFAVSELLANVSKHAEARQTWIDIRHTGEMLRIGVTDNGHGGAAPKDPARGSGLRGIERRLAAFDGVLAISSPPGGPTAVTMEIPCALSSPKTSSC